jgi:hypothetical protein
LPFTSTHWACLSERQLSDWAADCKSQDKVERASVMSVTKEHICIFEWG